MYPASACWLATLFVGEPTMTSLGRKLRLSCRFTLTFSQQHESMSMRPSDYIQFFTQPFIPLWMYRSHLSIRYPSAVLLISTLLAVSANARFVICADKSHPTLPTKPQDRIGIDHVIIAFAKANPRATFQSMLPMHTVLSEYPRAEVLIAV